uniref:Transposase n=1 Tax=Globodera rostochiensis TaxID=31243 RepID=A0A914H0A7_GLORO
MRNRGLLRQIAPICGRNGCPRRMTQVKDASSINDGYKWRCPSHKSKKISIRSGSFFENAKFQLRKGLMLGYCWALSLPIHTQVQIVRLTEKHVIDWNSFFRDVCSRWLIQQPIRLGGVGSVNHRQNFVCPVTGTHTNHVENFWKNLKMKNKAMSGTLRDMLPGYMDEYMWRQFNGKKTLAAFDNIFDQISQFYVVNV